MLDVLAFLAFGAGMLLIGLRIGRKKEPRIVGSTTVPMIEAAGQRIIVGKHDLTVANMVVSLAGERGPHAVTIDLVDSAEWEKQRRAS